MKKLLLAPVLGTLLAGSVTHGQVTLTAGPASLDILPDGVFSHWIVGGVNQLFAHEFFISINGAAEGQIGTVLSPPVFDPPAPAGNSVKLTYAGAGGITVINDLILKSGNSGGIVTSDLAQSLEIRNTNPVGQGLPAIQVSFYQYADFDLGGPGGDDSVTMSVIPSTLFGGNNISQVNPLNGGTFVEESFTQSAPMADYIEAGILPDPVDKLLDLVKDDLAVDTSIVTSASAGPGDVAWAVQWDFVLAPGEAFLISKDTIVGVTEIVPEPASYALILGLGTALILVRRRRA